MTNSNSAGGAGSSKNSASLLNLASLTSDWATARRCSHCQNFVPLALRVEETRHRNSSSSIIKSFRHGSIKGTCCGQVNGTCGFCLISIRSSRTRPLSLLGHCWSVGRAGLLRELGWFGAYGGRSDTLLWVTKIIRLHGRSTYMHATWRHH